MKLINADNVDGYGFEAEFETRPVHNLVLTAGLSYNRAKIDDPNAFITGCGAVAPSPIRAGSEASTDRRRTASPGPEMVGQLTAGYGVPMGNGELYAFTDWAYRLKVNFFLYTSEEFNDDHMLEGGLRVGYRTDALDIAAFVRNITNDVSAVGVLISTT